jgi:hypothetical protein
MILRNGSGRINTSNRVRLPCNQNAEMLSLVLGSLIFCVLQTVFSASSDFKINPQTLAILELLQLPDVFTAAFDGARRAPAPTASTSAQSFSFSADSSSAAASTSSSMYSTLASLASSNPEEISLDDVAHPASAAASLSNPEEIPLD